MVEWYNPFCTGPAIDQALQFSSCFQSTTLAFLPVLILAVFGIRELLSKSDAKERGGVGALRLKLVRSAY